MAIVNGYAETEELRDWNSATQSTATANLERAINSASRAIDQYCQRHFYPDGTLAVPVARRFASPCGSSLDFGAFNDLADDTITVKSDATGDGTFETTWASTDYELRPLNPTAGPEPRPYTSLAAIGSRTFPTATSTGRSAQIEITGVWGWPAVPDAVHQACLLLASRIFKRKESPEGVAGFGEFGQIRVRATDPDVMALLDPYRRYAVLVA